MADKKILVPTDFTEAATRALDHALMIAAKSGDSVTLLHILDTHSKKLTEAAGAKDPDLLLRDICQTASQKTGVKCNYLTVKGNIFNDIDKTAASPEYGLMVIGTHGSRGIRQNLFGADMLKIAKKSPIPVLVIQEGHSAKDGYKTIVFPYGGHSKFENQTKATVNLAKLFNVEVHIYAVVRPLEEASAQTKVNIENAKKQFAENNIRFKEVKEEPIVYSAGFAKQTINYANRVNADIIAVMSVPSEEYSYISESDKEKLINNEYHIAVLMASDKY